MIRNPRTGRLPRHRERFSCGVIHATEGALNALVRSRQNAATLLARHERDGQNVLRAQEGNRRKAKPPQTDRVQSAVRLADGTRFWIVTDLAADTTTLFLPEEI